MAEPGTTPANGPETRLGIGVSPGTAYGPVVQVAPAVKPPTNEPAESDAEAGLESVKAAFQQVADDLEGRARHADDTAQQILKATALIAKDKGLLKAAGKHLAAGKGKANAIAAAVEDYAAQFEALGGYFAERVTDLRDVGSRAVAAVLGVPAPGVPHFSQPSVIVAEDLAPAETATLDRALVVGIITQAGGRTSHTAILAAQMGIPAVVQCPEATMLAPGTRVAVDGDSGEVTIAPSGEFVEGLRERREKRAAALTATSGEGRTQDGFHVALLANIGGIKDAEEAGPQDLEGVGLFRTEFVFLSSDKAPTVEEQTDIYTKVFQPFGDRRVVVRTLSMRGLTSRWPSPTSARRRTLPSVVAACVSRPSDPTCSTPNSRHWPMPPRPRVPMSASWRRWWPRPRRPTGSPGGCVKTDCPRPAS